MSFDYESVLGRYPHDATTKGVLFTGLVANVRKHARSFDPDEVLGGTRRFAAFLDYPGRDWMLLAGAGAHAAYPKDPHKTALRKLARPTFSDLRGTRAGAIVLDALSGGIETLLLSSPRIYRYFGSTGPTSAEKLGPENVRIHYRSYAGLLDSFDVGILEGVLDAFGKRGSVQATVTGAADGYIDLEWD